MAAHEIDTPDGLQAFLRGQGTGEVPCKAYIMGTVWDEAPQFFEKLMSRAPDVKISTGRDPERRRESTKTDAWGCQWHFPGRYLDGQVVGHPLADWAAYGDYQLPPDERYCNWADFRQRAKAQRREGETVWGNVEHGFLYLRMTYLRGFENFMIDVAERRRELWQLRDRIADYWVAVVRRYAEIGVDAISFGDDLGHQNTLPMAPELWRDLLKGAYAKIYGLCRENGIAVYMHTDGWILDIIPDLIEAGVDILNPQDLVNGLSNLERLAKGKACIDLDIDRQSVTVFGKPADVDAHVRGCIQALGSPAGGLMLIWGVYPGTPNDNIAACVEAMQKHHDIWAKR